jgi:PKD repeat protein
LNTVSLTVFLILLALLVIPVSADNYVGGLPLTTIQTGTISGDLWFDAIPPTFATSVTKDFTLPAAATGSNVQWARLYISTYNGHMQDARHGTITIRWDNSKDGTDEASWTEDLNVPFVYVYDGGNDNTGQGGGSADPYKIVNNHCNRVTSDYLMWYDVKSLLTTRNIRVNAVASPVSSSFDGRIKMVALVVAYNDGDADQMKYWVNQGHDSCSYYTEDNFDEVAVGSTTFGTTGLGSISSATLTATYIASSNGYYGFPTAQNTFVAATKTGHFTNSELDNTPDVQGSYAGVKSWDVTARISGSGDVALGYARYLPGTGNGAFFKIPLAFLKVQYVTTPAPVAGFTATPLSGTAPLIVSFTDTSTNTPTSWKWEYRTGSGGWTEFGSGARYPSNTFAAGTYDIRLTAANSAGTDDEIKAGYISVNAATLPPVAAFGATPTSGTTPLTVAFSDSSTGTITSRTWDFDNDGIVDSTTQNPSHTYSIPGSYTVNLTVSGPGGSDSERKTGYITVMPAPPVAAFTATPRSGSPPLAVTFTDQSTNNPTSWKWEYKNATVGWTSFAFTKNPSYSFVTGTYDIRLNATNSGGSDEETKTGYINVNITPVPPNADFSADHTLGSIPFTVRFSDASAGTITGWAWDLNGDGNIDSTDQEPVYTYTVPGSYTVNLTVSGPGGTDSVLKTGYITVTSTPLIAAFSATPKSGYPPLAVTFTDLSTGTVTEWAWDFTSDGTIDSTTKDSAYTYSSGGIYIVNLTVTGPGGSSSTWDTITVSQTAIYPDANFTADVVKGTVPLTVKFKDKSEGKITAWAWDFNNDGRTDSTEQNPTYIYPETGVYTVILTVTGPAGSDTEKKTDYINVRGAPDCDLAIGGAINPLASTVFAKEPNTIRIFNVKNNGPGISPATTIELKASDGFTGRGAIPSLASGGNTTIQIVDTTIRSGAGQTVRYNVTVDPDDDVGETDETNNVKTSTDKVVTYNGYKGKRYWDGMDITTRKTFDLKGGLVQSFGNSVYRSGSFGGSGWTTNTMTWSPDDLPLPENATVKQAVLYAPYTWDNTNEIETLSLSFNDASATRGGWYHDKSNFGVYADYVYGLVTYDVTSLFKKNAENTATFSRGSSEAKFSMYGCTLAVVYEDNESSRKQIFFNEGFDLLGADETGYATTPDEATAYVPFFGLTIDPAKVSRADLTTFVASGDNEGSLQFNDDSLGSSVWDYGASSGPQVAIATREVSNNLAKTGNIAKIQSTDGETPVLGAIQQFLVVEYGSGTSVNRTSTALIANFTAEPLNGTAPLKVNFTDQSTGNPFSWTWDFENDGIIDNTTQNPQYIYQNPGNYSVVLTVKNATASHSVNKTSYIVVNNATVIPNVTAQPVVADPTSTVSYLKAPPEDTVTQDPTESGMSADATSAQEKSGDLIGGFISVLKGVIDYIAGELNTLIQKLPFIGTGEPVT